MPPRFWVNVLLAAPRSSWWPSVRHAAQINKLVLGLIVFLWLSVVSFQWVYERNEPRFLTPYVEQVAPFFPARSSIATKAWGVRYVGSLIKHKAAKIRNGYRPGGHLGSPLSYE